MKQRRTRASGPLRSSAIVLLVLTAAACADPGNTGGAVSSGTTASGTTASAGGGGRGGATASSSSQGGSGGGSTGTAAAGGAGGSSGPQGSAAATGGGGGSSGAGGAAATGSGGAGGAPTCVPQPETCNGVDDDCNGLIDDGDPGGGAVCATGLLGVCGSGIIACSNTALACTSNVQPGGYEVCDGLDSNCNGRLDVGAHLWAEASANGFGAPRLASLSGGDVVGIVDTYAGDMSFAGGTIPATPAGGALFRLDASGSLIWTRPVCSGSRLAVGAVDSIVVVGSISASCDIGDAVLVPAGPQSVYALRIDAAGTLLQSAVFGGATGHAQVRSVAAGAAGAAFVAGTFFGTTDLGTGPLAANPSDNPFVLALDAALSPLWARWIHASYSSSPLSSNTQVAHLDAAARADGHVYLAGDYAGGLDLGGGMLPTPSGCDDPFVCSSTTATFLVDLAPDGSVVWSRAFDSVWSNAFNGEVFFTDLAVDASDAAILGGNFGVKATFGPFVLTSPLPWTTVGYAARVRPDGIVTWAVAGSHVSVGGVAAPPGGPIVVAGQTDTAGAWGGVTLASASGLDPYVLALDPIGVATYGVTFHGSGNETVQSLAATPAGDLILAGGTTGPVDFGGGPVGPPLGQGTVLYVAKLGGEVCCTGATCACHDGVLDGGETGVDCGGPCAPCPGCNDGLVSDGETGIDCGGPQCGACPDGEGCLNGADCQVQSCIHFTCQAPSCTDGVQNQGETDVDCGGPCTHCANGLGCLAGSDCSSLVCTGGVCQAPTCSDGVKNGNETVVDCGGSCVQPETCNGKDDDCNGIVDDGLGTISCGLGACKVTVAACANGQAPACTPLPPSAEVCNGIDDDCDGVADNGSVCCMAATCQSFGVGCGLVSDGCGGVLDCGSCGPPVLAANSDATCATTGTGRVTCWGAQNLSGGTRDRWSATVLGGILGATSVDIGQSGGCALLANGTVSCWTGSGPSQVPGISSAVNLSVGGSHQCVVLSNGNVLCWGANSRGQLGNGSTVQSATPVQALVPSMATVTGGLMHTCARTAAGDVWCWGDNQWGQLGGFYGGNMQAFPVQIAGLTGIVALTAGEAHTCGLTSIGTVLCWGMENMLGIGSSSQIFHSTPAQVQGLSNVVAVAAGAQHTCALDATGNVKCWGNNLFGKLGDGTTQQAFVPVAAVGVQGAIAVAAGYQHSCAMLSDGSIHCWGEDGFGELGDATAIDSKTPVKVVGYPCPLGTANVCGGCVAATCASLNATSGVVPDGCGGTLFCGNPPSASGSIAESPVVAATGAFGCALAGGGTVKCWGQNASGQLGNGGNVASPTPVLVSGLSDATAVTVGAAFACALRSGGAVSCWGKNTFGQLGDGTTQGHSVPAAVPGLTGATEIAAGDEHACARTADGHAWCWGRGTDGALGTGTGLNVLSPVVVPSITTAVTIAAGYHHSCSVLENGTVVCWGFIGTTAAKAFAPQVMPGIETAARVVVGKAMATDFACALLQSGGVACMGLGTLGQLGDGASTTHAVALPVPGLPSSVDLAAGGADACALGVDGTVRCWGDGTHGELGNGANAVAPSFVSMPGSSGTTAVGAGGRSTCVLFGGGTASCTGDDTYGQLGDGMLTSRNLLAPVTPFP